MPVAKSNDPEELGKIVKDLTYVLTNILVTLIKQSLQNWWY